MKVRDAMTGDVATARLDTTLDDIASMMKDENVGAIPVIEDGELAGIVTDRDIVIRCIADGRDPSDTTVEDVLSEQIQTIEPDADLEEAAQMMSGQQIRRLPVVEDGVLIGMISLGDIAVKGGDEDVTGETLEDVSEVGGLVPLVAEVTPAAVADLRREGLSWRQIARALKIGAATAVRLSRQSGPSSRRSASRTQQKSGGGMRLVSGRSGKQQQRTKGRSQKKSSRRRAS